MFHRLCLNGFHVFTLLSSCLAGRKQAIRFLVLFSCVGSSFWAGGSYKEDNPWCKWFDRYSPSIQQMLEQYPDLQDKLKAEGLHSILDLWDRVFADPNLKDKTAYEGLGIKVAVGVRYAFTYKEVEEKSRAVAAYLQSRFKTGDRIALMMPASPQLAFIFMGVIRAGMVPMIVLTAGETQKLGELLAAEMQIGEPCCLFSMETNTEAVTIAQRILKPESGVDAEVAGPWSVRNMEIIMSSLFGGETSHPARQAAHHLAESKVAKKGKTSKLAGATSLDDILKQGTQLSYEKPKITPDLPAFMQFTSGTTGTGKAIVITHKNMLANAYQIKVFVDEKLAGTQHPVIFQPLPVTHSFGAIMTVAVAPMLGGHTYLVLNPKDDDILMSTLERAKPDVIFAVDRLLEKFSADNLKEKARKIFRQKSPALTVAGASSISARTRQNWYELSGCRVTEGYGASETTVALAIEMTNQESEPGNTGLIPLPWVRGEVLKWEPGMSIHDGFSASDFPPDVEDGCEVGQLLIAGDNVACDYYKNEEATREAFIKDKEQINWWVSGDLVALDQVSGCLKITGRAKETIIVSGQNVTPPTVENAAKTHPDVEQVIAFAIPKHPSQPAGDDRVGLFVVAKENSDLTAESLAEHMRAGQSDFPLKGHEVPRKECIVIKSVGYEIPRTVLFKEQRVMMKMGVLDAMKKANRSREDSSSDPWAPQEIEEVLHRWLHENPKFHTASTM